MEKKKENKEGYKCTCTYEFKDDPIVREAKIVWLSIKMRMTDNKEEKEKLAREVEELKARRGIIK